MRFLRFNGFSHSRSYSSSEVSDWEAGTVRSVTDDEAKRLLSTFPDSFNEPGKAPAVKVVQAVVLPDVTWRELVKAIEQGDHDDSLRELKAKEIEGKRRKAIVGAIDARQVAMREE